MLNSYTLEVYRKENKPCIVVTIKHIMRSGVYFFNTLPDANKFVADARKDLEIFAKLAYDNRGNLDEKYALLIKTVLSCDNIQIGENGKTYMKEI